MDTRYEITDVLALIKRRKGLIFIPMLLTAMAATAVAFMLPPKYQAKATILVETQDTPERFSIETGSRYVEERIQSITQRVLSRGSLLTMVEKNDLWPDLRAKGATEELLSRMRASTIVEAIQAEGGDARAGRPAGTTIGLTLAFESHDPVKAAQVTDALASLFLQENQRTQTENTKMTQAILEKQASGLRLEINTLDQRIASFKERNMLLMPEMTQLHVRQLEDLDKSINQRREYIRQLRSRKALLQSQLASLKSQANQAANEPLTPQEKYDVLWLRYLELRAGLSENHPDVVALKKQLASLRDVTTASQDYETKVHELRKKRDRLAELRQTRTDDYPDVAKLAIEVRALEREVQALKVNPGLTATATDKANPALMNLREQIATTDLEITSETRLINDQIAHSEELARRIGESPGVEQTYNALMRDYQNLDVRYKDTLQRLQRAKDAKVIEENSLGGRLTLIDPPRVPEKPFSPNRPRILLMGLILSIMVGIGFGAAGEVLDSSLRSAADVRLITSAPVLGRVPYLKPCWSSRKAGQRA